MPTVRHMRRPVGVVQQAADRLASTAADDLEHGRRGIHNLGPGFAALFWSGYFCRDEEVEALTLDLARVNDEADRLYEEARNTPEQLTAIRRSREHEHVLAAQNARDEPLDDLQILHALVAAHTPTRRPRRAA